MADKYVYLDKTNGRLTEREALQSSSGSGDAGKLPALNANGVIDGTMLPPGVGEDADELTAGDNLSAGDMVYVDSSGEAKLATAASSGVPAQGFVLTTVSSGETAKVYWEGRNTAKSSLTPGARQYLDDSTPGAITETPVTGTGKLHQYVGRAISSTTLVFEPDDQILLA